MTFRRTDSTRASCTRRRRATGMLLMAGWLAGCADRTPIVSVPGSQPAVQSGAARLREHYDKHEYQIPMRDGVTLFTAVYIPKRCRRPAPILLKRTPYSVAPYGEHDFPEFLGPSRRFEDQGYIFAYQDVRGKSLSQGVFDNMRRHIAGKRSPNDIDESSDTYDTIEWLLAHVPNHNGRVGMHGISYPGFYCSAGAIDSHPALKAVSPQAPVADWWFDDFHHHGAFFLPHAFGFMAVFDQPRSGPGHRRPPDFNFPTSDGYQFFLDLGPVANSIKPQYLGDRLAFWNQMLEHPNYDEFWQQRNILPHLRNIRAAVMTVGGWYDAEDLYGTFETYRAIERQNPGIFNVLVAGPWAHGGWARGDGRALGNIDFGEATSQYYQEEIELEFFNSILQHDRRPDLPEASVFETGDNRWREFDQWPPRSAKSRSLFLTDANSLQWTAPDSDGVAYDAYVSDPRRPVPFTEEITPRMTKAYMTDDQRFAGRRPDVVSYQTPPLGEPITLAGPLTAYLWVSTSGTDSDWIVKLIDVYPPGRAPDADAQRKRTLDGYQMMVRSEVFRGRFRESYERPEAFAPNEPTLLRIPLMDVLHTFQRGHRLMVQVQSTWFPLVDRNPQTFVANIYRCADRDFSVATQRVYHTMQHVSRIEVRVLN